MSDDLRLLLENIRQEWREWKRDEIATRNLVGLCVIFSPCCLVAFVVVGLLAGWWK